MDFELSEPRVLVNDRIVEGLEVHASLAVPWRTARITGPALRGPITAQAGYRHTRLWTIFEGTLDDPREDALASGTATARSLSAWRAEVPAQGFQDVRLDTLLQWIADRAGVTVQLAVPRVMRRHYQLTRGPAHRAAREALAAFDVDAVTIELDGGQLYIGPEHASPHATANVQAVITRGDNLAELTDRSGGRYQVVVPAMPWVRVGHRLTLNHPLVNATVRVTDVRHIIDADRTLTELEVIRT